MKPCSYLTFLLIGAAIGLQAQRYDYQWVFGFENAGSIGDFNQYPVSFEADSLALTIGRSNACISDSTGHLLFYTNGCAIANAHHEIMENGEGINPGSIHDAYCEYGYVAGMQTCLILPKPGSDYLFYLFHKHIITINQPVPDVVTDILYYSLIDMSLDDGAGAVIVKNHPLIDSVYLTYGQLTAIRHANGQDWWILTGGDQTNAYFTIRLNQGGLQEPEIQNIGPAVTMGGSSGGQAVFSPDGSLYARYSAADGVFLFDFDRQSGLLSNFRHIPIGDPVISGGVAISPNSRYLYVSSTLMVYQYDLWADDIAATKDTVAVYDGFAAPFATTFYNAQLAPDCKIYLNSQNGVNRLHVIHHPDEPGDACNFEQHGIELPYPHAISLPNFPNYRLGPLVSGQEALPPCHTVVRVSTPEAAAVNEVWVFPNPATTYLKVVLERPAEARLWLFDAAGKALRQESLSAATREHRIELQGLPPGMYFYRVKQRNGRALSGKVAVVPGG